MSLWLLLFRLTEVTFRLQPRGPGLGISIVGGSGSHNGDLPIVIKRVLPGSLAEENGRLKSGDELVAVNEMILVGASKDNAINHLSEAKGDIRLLVLQDIWLISLFFSSAIILLSLTLVSVWCHGIFPLCSRHSILCVHDCIDYRVNLHYNSTHAELWCQTSIIYDCTCRNLNCIAIHLVCVCQHVDIKVFYSQMLL